MLLPALALASLVALQDSTAEKPAPPAAWTQAELEVVAAEIRGQVEELRGAKFARAVKVELTDAKGLREYVRRRETQTQTPERLKRDETIAKLLGLVAPDLDLPATMLAILEKQVGGFYDPGARTFYLMDTFRGGVAKVILAHELTHALDDQLFDIDATLKKAREESDAELAFQSVVEGSGSNAMNRWSREHGKELSMSELQALQELGADELRKAPPYLWKPMLAAYQSGDAFLVRAGGINLTLAGAKPEDVARAFREPPRSMEQVLHPEKYWNAAKRDEPRPVSIDATQRPEGWDVLGQDTLGEFGLALLATPPGERKGLDASNPFSILQVKFTNRAAEGWGGDRALLLGKGGDRFLEVATLWDTPKDADEFEAALAKSAPKLWGDAPRDREKGWREGHTPTGWSVSKGQHEGKSAWVVVRAWSVADPKDASAKDLTLPHREI